MEARTLMLLHRTNPIISALFFSSLAFCLTLQVAAQGRAVEAERQKAVNKQQFTQNFRNLQLSSQAMLREHEDGKLTGAQLGKITRSINKSAKTLRGLMALGELAEAPEEFEKAISGQEKFDHAIRQLSQLVYDFAHSPVHQNSKVFNTKAAAKAQTQLLTIIELSKTLEDRSRDYASALTLQGNGYE